MEGGHNQGHLFYEILIAVGVNDHETDNILKHMTFRLDDNVNGKTLGESSLIIN